MKTRSSAKHIVSERLDHDYVKALCGKIILSPGKDQIIPDPAYFRYNHPDCQACLRQYFSRADRRKP